MSIPYLCFLDIPRSPQYHAPINCSMGTGERFL